MLSVSCYCSRQVSRNMDSFMMSSLSFVTFGIEDGGRFIK